MTRIERRNLLADAIAAFEAVGKPVNRVRICPDGAFEVLTGAPSSALPSNDDADWVDLAGQTEIPRAKGA